MPFASREGCTNPGTVSGTGCRGRAAPPARQSRSTAQAALLAAHKQANKQRLSAPGEYEKGSGGGRTVSALLLQQHCAPCCQGLYLPETKSSHYLLGKITSESSISHLQLCFNRCVFKIGKAELNHRNRDWFFDIKVVEEVKPTPAHRQAVTK